MGKVQDNQGGRFFIPMVVSRDAARDFGIDRKEVVMRKIGAISYPCVLVEVTEEQYRGFMPLVWAEAKRQEREGTGVDSSGTKRCKKCWENCRKCTRECFPFIGSLDALEEGGSHCMGGNVEDEAVSEIVSEGIREAIAELDDVDKQIVKGLLFEMTEREIAKAIGISSPAVHKRRAKLRQVFGRFREGHEDD